MKNEPEVKTYQDLLHRLDDFFTKLLSGDVETKNRGEGLCSLLRDKGFAIHYAFSNVIDVTKWELYSGDKDYPVPLEGMRPTLAYDTHDDLWDKKHPYGRNRWEFVQWCHEQVKAQIEKSVKEDIEFPVLAKGLKSGRIVLFDNYNSGLVVGVNHNDNESLIFNKVGDYSDGWFTAADRETWTILKTAKELGLTLRGEK